MSYCRNCGGELSEKFTVCPRCAALRGTGVIGSICVSGFDDHLDDHQLVINTLAEYLA